MSRRAVRLAIGAGALLAAAALIASQVACGARASAAPGRRVIVLGFDGLDYGLTRKLMDEGRMPNFSRLAAEGTFQPLGTAIPPQSPVAWSNFITGLDAGGHGIFDFIHRDPETMIPYLSTSRAEGPKRLLKLGRYQFPLEGGKVELLRKGEAFWEDLEKHGIDATVLRIPANFPPSGKAYRELSGMGTPDILGTYGTFSLYTTQPFLYEGKDISGGKVYAVDFVDDVVTGDLYGPDNPFLVEPEKVKTPFTVYVDPKLPVAKIVVGDEERILKVGEFSDWVPFEFSMIPTQKIHAEVRFLLKQVDPIFELYASPVNMDPLTPALPISTPSSYAAELAKATGRYYTQGMPEDTKGLITEVLDRDQFLAQAAVAGQEVIDQYPYVLDHFKKGLLFYYFGNSDQVSHMMWRTMDPGHPAYDPAKDAPYKDVIPHIYEQLDGVVGETLARMGPDTTLVVMSDHGFTSWRRSFHLNTWLKQNGYLAVINPNLKKDPGFFANVDWSRTRAYGLGLNGLYINLRGREKWGIVSPSEKKALMDEISAKLLATVDPKTGKRAITKVFESEEAYHDRGALDVGPDIVVGYAKMTRSSNESALGGVGPDVFSDNLEEWSGDHCMDPDAVPGILLASHKLKKPAPDLKSLAAAILAEFGIEDFPPRSETARAVAHTEGD